MIKWFAYIVVLMIFVPALSSAKTKPHRFKAIFYSLEAGLSPRGMAIDTTKKNDKKQDQDKVKDVARAKKQPKPEKVEAGDNTTAAPPKKRPKRQRRPEGLERPPEIPRRNGG
jgi:hypothetical protein